MVYDWLRATLDTILPGQCLVCGWAPLDADLCAACTADLPWLTSCCSRCALPLPRTPSDRGLCPACLRRPPPQAGTHALFHYAAPVDGLVSGLKYGARLSHARLLGRLLAERGRALPAPAALLPVPLHPARLRTRGFNQAVELARPLARALGVPLALGLASRVRDTPAQVGLTAAARRRNLRAAFRVHGPVPASLWVVDDVMTTGATVAALAGALRSAGCAEVHVWCVARAE